MGGFLTNPYTISIIVPIIIILSSAFAKKIVRGSSWVRSDFFLGVELSLSAIAGATTYFIDLSKSISQGGIGVYASSVVANAVFLSICFLLLLVILATHQEWERAKQSPGKQVWWLGVFCNFLGACLLMAFILVVKGV
jgi:hypothetical protein